MVRSVFLMAIIIAGHFSCRPVRSDEPSALIESLLQAWEEQQNEVQTARVNIRILNGPVKSEIGWEEAKSLLSELATAEGKENWDEFNKAVIRCAETLYGRKALEGWTHVTVLAEGSSLRNIRVARHSEVELTLDTRIRDGTSTEYFSTFQEAHLNPRTPELGQIPLSDLRFVPKVTTGMSVAKWEPFLPETFALDWKIREWLVAKLLVDKPTNIVRWREVDGGFLQLFGRIAQFPGDVSWPTYGVQVSLRNGKVRVVEAFLVDDAIFNKPIDASDWEMVTPANTRVVDKREGIDRKRIGTTTQAQDPLVFADTNNFREVAPPLKRASRKAESHRSWGPVFVWANVVILISVAIIYATFLRRR